MKLEEGMYYTRTNDGKLGLCKCGNLTPKEYVDTYKDIYNIKNADVYYDDDCNTLGYKYNLEVMLDSEVEIIEEVEDKEYEDIEEIGNLLYIENQVESILHRKIDALIRNQKYILERLDK